MPMKLRGRTSGGGEAGDWKQRAGTEDAQGGRDPHPHNHGGGVPGRSPPGMVHDEKQLPPQPEPQTQKVSFFRRLSSSFGHHKENTHLHAQSTPVPGSPAIDMMRGKELSEEKKEGTPNQKEEKGKGKEKHVTEASATQGARLISPNSKGTNQAETLPSQSSPSPPSITITTATTSAKASPKERKVVRFEEPEPPEPPTAHHKPGLMDMLRRKSSLARYPPLTPSGGPVTSPPRRTPRRQRPPSTPSALASSPAASASGTSGASATSPGASEPRAASEPASTAPSGWQPEYYFPPYKPVLPPGIKGTAAALAPPSSGYTPSYYFPPYTLPPAPYAPPVLGPPNPQDRKNWRSSQWPEHQPKVVGAGLDWRQIPAEQRLSFGAQMPEGDLILPEGHPLAKKKKKKRKKKKKGGGGGGGGGDGDDNGDEGGGGDGDGDGDDE